MSFRYIFPILVLCAGLFQLSSAAHGQGLQNNQRILQANIGLNLIYDDNVWQYSDSDLETFKDTPSNPLFQRTESRDDFIWQPYLYLNLQPFKKSPSTRLYTDFTGYFYHHNTALNLGIYQIGLRQAIGPQTRTQASYTLIPREFLGISRERRGSNLVEETIATHTIRFRIEQEISNLDLGLNLHYKFKDYNDSFDEQDSDIYGIGLGTKIYFGHGLKTRLEYQFEQGLAAGRTSPNTCVTNNNITICLNDLSYFSNQFMIQPEIQPLQRLTLNFKYELKHKEFTTNLTNDTNHYGRRDFLHAVGLNLYYEITKAIETKLGYKRVMRRTNRSSEFYAYDENVATVGISYLFR